jgi:hypothetical protein
MNPRVKKIIIGTIAAVATLGVGIGKRFLKREARYAAAVATLATAEAAAQALSSDSTKNAAGATIVNPPSAATPASSSITTPIANAEKAVAAANARTQASSTLPADEQKDSTGATANVAAGRVGPDTVAAPNAAPVARGAAFERETYLYERAGRRDPFVSLMTTSELRPLISDLKLVAVAYDPSGRNSVAVLHDIADKDVEQYRIRVGQSLGRMRVAGINPKSVVFTIEEFGYSRQETLAMKDSNKERKQ